MIALGQALDLAQGQSHNISLISLYNPSQSDVWRISRGSECSGLICGAMVEHQGLRLKKGAAAQAGVSQLLFSLIEQCLPIPSICQAQPDHPPAQPSQSLFPRQVYQIVWYKEQLIPIVQLCWSGAEKGVI